MVTFRDECSKLRSQLNEQHREENRVSLEQLTKIKDLQREDLRGELQSKIDALKKTVSTQTVLSNGCIYALRQPFCRLSHELFHPLKWLNSNFSLQYLVWITYKGHKNKGNEDQLKKLSIVKQILVVSIFRNVWWTVLRIYILILVSNALEWAYFRQSLYWVKRTRLNSQ